MEANRMSKVSGMRASDGGTNPKFFGKYAAAHGYGMSEGPVDSKSIASNLRKGQPVVVMGKGGAFGKNMHYMVAERDTGRGGVGIVDPLTGARKSTTMEGLVRYIRYRRLSCRLLGCSWYGRLSPAAPHWTCCCESKYHPQSP